MAETSSWLQGLSPEQVNAQLSKHGTNTFEEGSQIKPLLILRDQFTNPLTVILLVAGIISLLTHDYLDAVVILIVGVGNAILGFWQEFKAARSLESLKDYLKPKVLVRRQGESVNIPMESLVPHDIVLLNSGMSIPADGVLIACQDLLTNESLLTGESRPIHKKAVNPDAITPDTVVLAEPHAPQAKTCGYMGTTVVAGIGELLVVKTGEETQMGKIATSLLTTDKSKTPLQLKMEKLSNQLMVVVLGLTVTLFILGLFRGENAWKMFETAVAVAVAAIPEGLAVSMTVILALGMQRMAKRKALVRRLVAAETLGSVTVICCDKTGTLTEGQMRVVGHVGSVEKLAMAAVLANDERDEEGLAMRAWVDGLLSKNPDLFSKTHGVAAFRAAHARLGSLPFDSRYKYMVSVNQFGTGAKLTMIGAPEIVLTHCQLDPAAKRQLMEQVKTRAMTGLRLLGVAIAKVDAGTTLKRTSIPKLEWLGLIELQDPLRPSVAKALYEAESAGIGIKVITGDYKETALAVLKQLSPVFDTLSDHEVMTGDELRALTPKALADRIGQTRLFARTTPDQKLTIVAALQANGQVVAMTGDGVNDAPALQAADIGVVVNEATDVSKQTADMVLLNSNFKTIIAAVAEGRSLYESLRKLITFLLGGAFQELVLLGGAILIGLPLPLVPVQILWINLIVDGLPGLSLAFERSKIKLNQSRPYPKTGSLLDSQVRGMVATIAIVSNSILLVFFGWLLSLDMELIRVQTMMYTTLASNTLLFLFSIKNMKKSVFHTNLTDNRFLLVSVVIGVFLILASLYVPWLNALVETVPLSLPDLLMVAMVSLLNFALVEVVKMLTLVRRAK